MENQTELVRKWEVNDTPFTVVQDNETDLYFGVVGNYRITELYETRETLEEELKTITWNKIMQVLSIIMNLNVNLN